MRTADDFGCPVRHAKRIALKEQNGWRWWGLRSKTTLGIGALLLCSLLILGFATYFAGRSLAIRQLLKTIDSNMSLDGSALVRTVQDSRADLLVIRDTPPIQGLIRAMDNGGVDPLSGVGAQFWTDRMKQILGAFIDNQSRYLRLRYIDEKGQEVVRVDRGGGAIRIVPRDELVNVRDQAYFSNTISSGYGNIYYSDIVLRRDGDVVAVPHTPVFRVAAPVFDAAGRARGVVVISVSAEDMLGRLRSVGGGGTMYLVNRDGYFIVHPDESKEFGFEFGEETTLGRLLPGIASDIGQRERGAMRDVRDKSIVGFRRVFFDPADTSRYWLLINRVPETIALTDINAVGRDMVLVGLLIIALSLSAVTWLVSRKLVSPIVRLAEAADSMEAGDLSVRADERRVKDELRVLYRSFNAFAATQQAAVERLEGEIAVRESAESALAQSEERFRSRLENMLEGCQIIDREYRYHFINDAAAAQGHKTKEELLGRTMMEAYPGIETTGLFAAIRASMVEGTVSHFENHFENPDGSSGWFELSVQPVPEGVFILSADISERKRAEAEHLAREAAEIANRTKSDFLANMSHELRTPLNSIIGFTEVLQDSLYGDLNEKQREYLGYIYASGRHLLELINDILDLAKVESGKTELTLSPFRVRAVVDLSVTMLKERAMKHAIALECAVTPEADVEIVSDEHKIRQIMFNLLSNAVKFTPDGGSVRVDARRSEGPSGCIEISVSDTGIGIKKEDVGRLFKEFSQLDSPLQKRYEGTGLGLALSKRLIEMVGGTIRVKSEEGRGSVFSIDVPLDPPDPAGRAAEGGRGA